VRSWHIRRSREGVARLETEIPASRGHCHCNMWSNFLMYARSNAFSKAHSRGIEWSKIYGLAHSLRLREKQKFNVWHGYALQGLVSSYRLSLILPAVAVAILPWNGLLILLDARLMLSSAHWQRGRLIFT
jgi:hypothetical protein